jgi:hypothetical protein
MTTSPPGCSPAIRSPSRDGRARRGCSDDRKATTQRGVIPECEPPALCSSAVRFLKLTAAIVLVLAATAGCGSSLRAPRSSSLTAPNRVPATTGPANSGTIASGTPACTNDTVTASVLAALTVADGRATAAELPGHTFYGNCGDRRYAVAALVAGPLATQSQMAAFGSGAATAEFFTGTGDLAWTVTAHSAAGSYGCASFDIPTGLQASWGGLRCAAPS